MKRSFLFIILSFCIVSQSLYAQHSVAREWNEELLHAIRNDFARPTVHARNLFHTSAAMWDAWAVYDTIAEPFLLGKNVDGFDCFFAGIPVMPTDIEAAREEAISYAAYRLLRHRFQSSPNANATLLSLDTKFFELGYDSGYTTLNYPNGSPAALGNYIAACYINFGMQDNANEQNQYNNEFYEPVNPPLVTNFPGNPGIVDPNRWQPLTLDVFIDQGGNEIPFNTPPFLSPEWGQVTPFALTDEDLTIYNRDGFDYWVYHDPGDPPYIDLEEVGGISEEYKWGFMLVSVWSSHLDPGDSVMWDISPANIGNIQDYPTTFEEHHQFYDLVNGGDPSIGHDINPHTGMPYAPNWVPRADYARVLAEFWADGPDSETPPGHWFTLLNYVNDHPLFEKRYRGEGEILDDLEWDVKSYFMMGGAMHDCAISAWGIKGWYDYIRPISAIRAMADKGQSTEPLLPNYHPGGIPLVDGFVALVQEGDPLALLDPSNIGKIKVKAWKGPDYIPDPETTFAGVDWILAENWWPYQRPSFVTPNFAGYVSGHSTYSRAAAELMTLLTGDPFFPGGMGEFLAEQNEFLVFEEGPSQDVVLQWATYRDASDQTSLSRIWGGIHPPADDIPGRLIGMEIGVDAFDHAETYFFRDEDSDGFFDFEDCDDTNPDINPDADEICDAIDNNCNGTADEGLPKNTYYLDADNDGFGDAAMTVDTCISLPPEGYVVNDLDCDDTNDAIHPNAVEVCDAIDNDCNGMADDGLPKNTYFRDADNDNFGDAAITVDTCMMTPPEGYVANDLDCDDTNDAINPDAVEVCDAIDNDCNGMADDGLPKNTYFRDADNDTFGDAAVTVDTCMMTPPEGYVANDLDCDDTNGEIHPDAAEICDAIDNDCNGLNDDGLPKTTYYLDADNDGFGNAALTADTCITIPPLGYVDNDMDCDDSNDAIYPGAAEIADNGIDEDCDGIDLYLETKIFPNPVREALNIHYDYKGEIHVQVISSDAQIKLDFTTQLENNNFVIDFRDMAAGVYWIVVYDAGGRRLISEKVVRS